MRTGLRQRSFPGGKITRRIIGTPIEYPALARLTFGNLAAVFRAEDHNFLQPRLRIPAVRKIGTTDKFAVAPPADDQRMTRLRAIPPNQLGFGTDLRHL